MRGERLRADIQLVRIVPQIDLSDPVVAENQWGPPLHRAIVMRFPAGAHPGDAGRYDRPVTTPGHSGGERPWATAADSPRIQPQSPSDGDDGRLLPDRGRGAEPRLGFRGRRPRGGTRFSLGQPARRRRRDRSLPLDRGHETAHRPDPRDPRCAAGSGVDPHSPDRLRRSLGAGRPLPLERPHFSGTSTASCRGA